VRVPFIGVQFTIGVHLSYQTIFLQKLPNFLDNMLQTKMAIVGIVSAKLQCVKEEHECLGPFVCHNVHQTLHKTAIVVNLSALSFIVLQVKVFLPSE
jgi:hypothetical protein